VRARRSTVKRPPSASCFIRQRLAAEMLQRGRPLRFPEIQTLKENITDR
jgi:hypothetical protein